MLVWTIPRLQNQPFGQKELVETSESRHFQRKPNAHLHLVVKDPNPKDYFASCFIKPQDNLKYPKVCPTSLLTCGSSCVEFQRNSELEEEGFFWVW